MNSVHEDVHTFDGRGRRDSMAQIGDVADATELFHHCLGQRFQLLLLKQNKNKGAKYILKFFLAYLYFWAIYVKYSFNVEKAAWEQI